MLINKALLLGLISVFITGCQSWQHQDVDTLPPTAALPAQSQPGIVHALYWNQVPGKTVNDLTSLASYPDSPDQVGELVELRGPRNLAEDYGTLVKGYVIPPEDGNYRFFVSGDDETQFFLSSSEQPDQAQMIALAPASTPFETYTSYSSQTSGYQSLSGGKRYYFELRHKEGTRGDHWSVAWEGPTLSQQVIDSRYLASAGQSLYPDSPEIRTAYSLGYRVGFLDGSQNLTFSPDYPPQDNDQDGLYDRWEVIYALDPGNPSDATSDPDGDLLSATDEFNFGTAENKQDTDGDGIPDGAEFAYGLNPRDPSDAALDMDGDGFTNLDEYLSGSSMEDPDDTPYQEPEYVAGFIGQYFEGTAFERFVELREDTSIDFTWGRGQAIPSLPEDKFTVRWSGIFTAPHTTGNREYTFTTRSDDGTRLYLNGELVIDEWKNQGATSYNHTRSFAGGETALVSMEYYEHTRGAVAQFIITDTATGNTLAAETAIKTPSPMDTNTQDTDTDGIPDTWEIRHGLNPWANDAGGVSNAQGVSNIDAYNAGLDPWTLEPVPTPDGAPVTTEPSPDETTSAGGTITLTWTAPLTRIDGSSIALSEIDYYEVHYGQSPDNLNQSLTVDGTETSAEITGLEAGAWHFAMKVIDTSGLASPLSEPLEYLIP